LSGTAFGQQGGPWAPPKAGSTASTSGPTATSTRTPQFEADWGVKVESTISSFNDHPTKLTTMFAAGEKIDVSQSSPFSFPNFVNQGLAEPIDDLPGAADYIKDFTAFTKQFATVKGKTMGLPYFSAVWVWNYYADMMEKLKIDKPFTTYDEFIEHCVKAKKDGVSRYPVLWVAGSASAAGHLVPDDLEQGGTFFDKQQPSAGRLDRARREIVTNTFEESHTPIQIAEGPVHDFGKGLRGRQEPLPRSQPPLRPECRQRQGAVFDCRQGQGARLSWRRPHDRRRACLFPLERDSRQRVGLEAAAVSRGQDQGRPVHASHRPRQGCNARFGIHLRHEQ
jgi:hypothetical protein